MSLYLVHLQLAKAANVPVYLDAGGMEGPLDPRVLECLTLLSPNETELSRLTNMPTENEEQVSGRLCLGIIDTEGRLVMSVSC